MKYYFSQIVKMMVQNIFLPLLYLFFRVGRKIEDDLVLFADAHSNTVPYSMQQMHQAVSSMGYRVQDHLLDYGTCSARQKIHSIVRFMQAYARARYVFICSYYLPVSSCKKRKGTHVTQLWHASGVWKKFGYDSAEDIPRFYWGNQMKNYDLVTVSAPACIPYYASAFHSKPGICAATGISRTDRFFDSAYTERCKDALYGKHPELAGKRIALWAPTFRGNAKIPYTAGIDAMEGLELGKEWVLVAKVHANAKERDRLFQPDVPAEMILPLADVVITDYSTILFEAALMDKPIVLFHPDGTTYEETRGLYFPTNEIPAPLVHDVAALQEAIVSIPANGQAGQWDDFIKKYMSACDGNATKRIIEQVFIEKGNS